MPPKVIILGAGVSGLSLAWRLAGRGWAVDVLEADEEVAYPGALHFAWTFCEAKLQGEP